VVIDDRIINQLNGLIY